MSGGGRICAITVDNQELRREFLRDNFMKNFVFLVLNNYLYTYFFYYNIKELSPEISNLDTISPYHRNSSVIVIMPAVNHKTYVVWRR